jgi:hypothetical protein
MNAAIRATITGTPPNGSTAAKKLNAKVTEGRYGL